MRRQAGPKGSLSFSPDLEGRNLKRLGSRRLDCVVALARQAEAVTLPAEALEIRDGALPVAFEQTGEAVVDQEPDLGLAMEAIVGLVVRVAHARSGVR